MSSINRRSILMGAIAFIALFSASVAPALAQLPASSTPLVINTPGVYVLTRDIRVASGDAITINASGVTLDLNGRTVSTATAGAGRGVFVNGQTGVKIKNGKVASFNLDVYALDSNNVSISDLQIIGQNLPLNNGPSEIGILFISTSGSLIDHNLITGCSVGVFVRGPLSRGNTWSNNTIVGGPIVSRAPLGMCWNPLAGQPANAPGPIGDRAYNNHVSQFIDGFSFSAGTTGSFAFENTFTVTNVGVRPASMTGGNDVIDNRTIIIPIP